MKKVSVKVDDLWGKYANPVAELVQNSCRFDSEIYVEENGKKYNSKSIFSVMRMELKKGDVVTISVQGNDEAYALAKISQFLTNEKVYGLGGVI